MSKTYTFSRLAALGLAMAALAAPAYAADTNAVIGGAIGGAAGAAIGHEVGGREGAIIGGAIGGGAGAAVGSNQTRERVIVQERVVHVDGRHDNGLHLGHYKNGKARKHHRKHHRKNSRKHRHDD